MAVRVIGEAASARQQVTQPQSLEGQDSTSGRDDLGSNVVAGHVRRLSIQQIAAAQEPFIAAKKMDPVLSGDQLTKGR